MRKKKDLELLSLIPYTKGPIKGKGNKSFVEKLLLPRRVRMTIAEKGSYISTNSIKSKRVLPTTPPEIFQKPKTRGALKDTDLEKYEEYFRSSRYFQATGKLPEDWLVHFTEDQVKQVRKAREKVLKEKQEAGESAWKNWLQAKRRHLTDSPATQDTKDGEGKRRQPNTLMSQDERDAVWREWKIKKEKEMAIRRAEEKRLQDQLIAETMEVAARLTRRHPVGVGLPTSPTHNGPNGEPGHFPHPHTAHRKGTQRKRLPNAVKVALCQSSLSPYLIHPAQPYKRENIHALEEMQQIREMSWKAGVGQRLSLPELWRRRVERAKPTIFDRIPAHGERGHTSHTKGGRSPGRGKTTRPSSVPSPAPAADGPTQPPRSAGGKSVGSAYAHDDFEVELEDEDGHHRSGNQQKSAPTPAASQKAETAAKADGTPEPLPVSVAAAEGTGAAAAVVSEGREGEGDAQSVASEGTRYTRDDDFEHEEEEEEVMDDKALIAKVPVTEEALDFDKPLDDLPVDQPFKGDADYYSDDEFDTSADLPPGGVPPRPHMAGEARPDSRPTSSAGNRRGRGAAASAAGEAAQE